MSAKKLNVITISVVVVGALVFTFGLLLPGNRRIRDLRETIAARFSILQPSSGSSWTLRRSSALPCQVSVVHSSNPPGIWPHSIMVSLQYFSTSEVIMSPVFALKAHRQPAHSPPSRKAGRAMPSDSRPGNWIIIATAERFTPRCGVARAARVEV